jgi:hypothetical protein
MSGSNGPFRYPGGQPVATPFGGDQNAEQNAGREPASHAPNGQQGYYDNGPSSHDPYGQPQAPAHQSYAEHSPRAPRQLNTPQPAQPPQGDSFQPAYNAQAPQTQGYGGTDPQWTQAPPTAHAGTSPQFGSHDFGGQPAAQNYGHQDFGFSEPAATAPQQPSQPSFAHQPETQQPAPSFQQADPYAPAQPQQAAPSGYDFGAHHGASAGTDFPTASQAGDPGLNWGDGSTPQYANEQAFAGHQDFAFQDPAIDAGQQPAAMEHEFEDDDYEYEDDEGYGRGRKVLILAALAGAIVVGGGVAYGYQALFAPASSDAPPLVKSAQGPSKVKPSDPGGRKFAHTDSKIMGRLGSAGSQATTDPATGARRVSTMKIGRDGSIVPPSAPSKTGGPRMVSGMTLGDTGGLPAAGSAVKTASTSAPPIQMAKVAPVQKIKAAAPAATAAAVEIKNSTSAKAAPAPLAKPAPERTVTAALPPPKKPVATGPKPTGAGYVAVLASVPASKSSRMDALKQFADMQQKYGSVLGSRTPDVQEANLGAKGTYHRLIAGPPGSAQSARSVCSGLKSAGYKDCWVLAF